MGFNSKGLKGWRNQGGQAGGQIVAAGLEQEKINSY